MMSCFCWEKEARASAHVVVKIEDGTEMVPMGPLESSDDKDFENVEVAEERWASKLLTQPLDSRIFVQQAFFFHFSYFEKWIPKYELNVTWAYLTLIWLCFFDEGTDVYAAYQHFL